MYTIDAYDAVIVGAFQASSESRDKAIKEASRLARVWPIVEVRNPNDLNPDNQPIAAWLDGKRLY